MPPPRPQLQPVIGLGPPPHVGLGCPRRDFGRFGRFWMCFRLPQPPDGQMTTPPRASRPTALGGGREDRSAASHRPAWPPWRPISRDVSPFFGPKRGFRAPGFRRAVTTACGRYPRPSATGAHGLDRLTGSHKAGKVPERPLSVFRLVSQKPRFSPKTVQDPPRRYSGEMTTSWRGSNPRRA